jgi:hypothetical protein
MDLLDMEDDQSEDMVSCINNRDSSSINDQSE